MVSTKLQLLIVLSFLFVCLPVLVIFFIAEGGADRPSYPTYAYVGRAVISKPHTGKIQTTNKSSCLKHLREILLVVVYNYNTYDTIPILQRFYEMAFPNIVYCGPEKNDKYKVIDIPIEKGFWGYECLGEAIRRHPSYRGYFYINDDSIVNWWNLENYDIDKVWTGIDDIRNGNKGSDMAANEPSNNWYWWKAADAFNRCKKAFAELEKIAKSGTGLENIHINPEWLKTFFANTGGIRLCGESYSDVFYVPSKVRYVYSNVSHLFFKHKLFLEAAVPTILRFLGTAKNFQSLDGLYLRQKYGSIGFADGIHFWEEYDTSVTFFHPLKLSHTKISRKLFTDIVYTLGYQKLKTCVFGNSSRRNLKM